MAPGSRPAGQVTAMAGTGMAHDQETPPPEAAAHVVKVLTMNTHKGFNHFNRRFILPELRDAVRLVGSDVVFLQEVHGTHEHHARNVRNWPNRPQYEFLADSIWTEFAYGRNAVYPHGDHGNAVLSKFPIVRHQNLEVSVDGAEVRGILHCQLLVPGQREFHAICVHLGLREAERQVALKVLCRLLDELPPQAPVVVAGDFNDWRQRAGGVLAQLGLHEAFQQERGAVARSFPALLPALRLDRIYARNVVTRATEVLSRRPWSRLSDHLPLAAEIHL
jgi:endonuclease/exonuclease/phosphatase family metal-dependent hydrolase